MPVTLPRNRRFSVTEYHRMAESGVLRHDERVELIEGEIVQMAAIGSRHAESVSRLARLLILAVGHGALVRIQSPVRMSDLSEPEPDLAVVRVRANGYPTAHPQPKDVHLLIEVADRSATFDREVKAPLYAIAGIPEYWLVDLNGGVVEVRRQPSEAGYRKVTRYVPGDVLSPLAFPEIRFPVEEMLP